jgi:hypothetical protein
VRRVVVLLAAALQVASVSNAADPPSELTALLAKARVSGAVASWCRVEVRSNGPSWFAIAVVGSAGGRYVAVHPDARTTDLASFTGEPDLACYTPADARRLDRTLRQSATIEGRVLPRWNTTVICAFVEETTASCWQHSPQDRAFVKIGGWTT